LRARTGSESADSVFSIATAATLAASALPSGVAGVAVMTHKVSAKGSPRDTGFEVLIRSYDANSANRSYRGDDKVTHRTGRQFMERATLVRTAKMIGIWIPAILLVLIFAPQGWSKFSDASGWAAAFRHWGYPDWFRITIGVVEIAGALMLLWGRTAVVGAALLASVMLGGMGTHLVKEGGRHMTSEVVPLTLSTIVLVMRLRSARRKRANAAAGVPAAA